MVLNLSKMYTVISTFAGCGGSSLGYKLAGFKELLAIDFNKNAVETFKLNFPEVPVLQRDITTVSAGELLDNLGLNVGELDVLDGSPPCQGFSIVGKRKVSDSRNELFKSFVELIIGLKPKVFVMENVSGQIKGDMKGMFIEIVNTLKSLDYKVKVKLMNAKYYDVPQSRQRLIYIGVRNDINLMPVFPVPNNNLISVGKAIENVNNKTFRPMRDIDTEVYSYAKVNGSILKNVPYDLILKWAPRFINNKKLTFRGVRRLNPSKPSPTILKLITISSNDFIHPKENRQITIEEAKRLCSFPDSFVLNGNFNEQWAVLGNAVMPNMMKAIAINIKENILDKCQK